MGNPGYMKSLVRVWSFVHLDVLLAGLIAIILASLPAAAGSSKIGGTAEDGKTCPIYGTRNWHAWIDRGGDGEIKTRLTVVGQVDAPNPGYEIVLEPGPLDRRAPPSLRIRLIATPSSGPAAQVIDTREVRLSMATRILHYRSILIVCSDRLLAELPDVTPTE